MTAISNEASARGLVWPVLCVRMVTRWSRLVRRVRIRTPGSGVVSVRTARPWRRWAVASAAVRSSQCPVAVLVVALERSGAVVGADEQAVMMAEVRMSAARRRDRVRDAAVGCG